MGPGRNSSLSIGGDPFVVSSSGRTGGSSDRLTRVVPQDAPGEPLFPLDKGKRRIDEIKYPGGSEYLKSTVQNALAVGPSRVEPLYGETFTRRYRPPFGVQVWSPDGVLLRGDLRQWPPFPSTPLYKKGLATFQRLPFSTFAQFLGYFDWVVAFFQGQGLWCSQYSSVPGSF